MTPLLPWRPAILSPGWSLRFNRDEHLDHLEHARGQLVAALQLFTTIVELVGDPLDRLVILRAHCLEVRLDLVVGDAELPPFVAVDAVEQVAVDRRALLEALGSRGGDLAHQHLAQPRPGGAVEDVALVVRVLLQALDLLALDRHRAFVLVDAVAVEHADLDDGARHARRQAQRRVAHVRGLLAEDRAEQFLLRRHRRFALGRDLADQDVARLDLGADVDDAGLVEVAKRLLADVGDISRDVLGPELGVAGHDLELLDVDRGEDVVLDDALADEDRILVVVAVPRHERDERIPAQRQLAELGRGAVGDGVAFAHHFAHLHQRALVDAGVLVRALELHQRVDVDARFAGIDVTRGAHDDTRRIDLVDDARPPGRDGGARIPRDRLFHAGADERRLGADQRNRLALHVRPHQRAVGVVVLEERNERRRDRHELLGAHVHQRDRVGDRHQELARLARRDQLLDEALVLVQLGVGLRDRVLGLLHRREIDDLVGDLVVDDLAVRRLDEAVFVDAAEGREAVDQADVRPFGRLDRADAAIVRRMDVADLKTGPFASQTTRPERRDAALVRHLGERVGLVHELAELRRAEETRAPRRPRAWR